MPEDELPPIEEATAIVEGVTAPIAEAIAEAGAAQVEAEQTAEAIAAAAMESARGQRIEHLDSEIAACRTEINQMSMTLADLPVLMAEQTALLMEGLNSRLSAVEVALLSPQVESPNSSIPQNLAPQVETLEVAEPTAAAPASEEENPAPAPKRKRFQSL